MTSDDFLFFFWCIELEIFDTTFLFLALTDCFHKIFTISNFLFPCF